MMHIYYFCALYQESMNLEMRVEGILDLLRTNSDLKVQDRAATSHTETSERSILLLKHLYF